MKKLLFAVLFLTPSFAAAEPASLANRINVMLNVSQQDTRGNLDADLKAKKKDSDASVGFSVGYNFIDMLEVGLGLNVLASYDYTDTGIDHDVTWYSSGIYVKGLSPQIQLSSDTSVSLFGKVGIGQYFYDDSWKVGHVSSTESYDHTGMLWGVGGDINFPNWIIGLEYQLHRVDYVTISQNIGLNVGYRF